MIQAIRDDDPVIFLESKVLYDTEDEVPEEAYRIPFGEANIVKSGKHVTVVALGAMVRRAVTAADKLGKDGVSVEVIDDQAVSGVPELDERPTATQKASALIERHAEAQVRCAGGQ